MKKALLTFQISPKNFLVFFFFMFAAVAAFAQNATLSVQGVLTKSDGTAVDDGTYPITFRLWTAETGGTQVHEETIQQVETTGGVYSVLLGKNGFQSTATFNQVYYLGVSVNGSAEFSPRPRLTHSPYTMAVIGQSNKFTSTGAVEADAYQATGGAPTAPVAGKGYSFRNGGDFDGGMFSYADDHVGLFTNATERIKVTGGLTELKSTVTNTNHLFAYGSTYSNGGYYWHDNGAGQVTGMAMSSGLVNMKANGEERLLLWNNGNNYYRTPNGQHIFDQGNVQMNTLTTNGNITSNGSITSSNSHVKFSKPLEVLSGAVYSIGSYQAYCNGPCGTTSNGNISAFFSGEVAAGAFYAYSDRRIKKDMAHVNPSEALSKLQKLQVTDYRYIDEAARGKGIKKGFIAQEVEAVEPEAISINTGFLPSVYALAERVDIRDGQAILKMAKPHGLQKGERVRLFDANNQQQDLEVLESGETEFTVAKWDGATETNAFVFGKEVSDFHSVDYDHIFTMNVAATQELARRTEVLENENAALRAQLASQSAAIGELAKRMNLMENNGVTGMRK